MKRNRALPPIARLGRWDGESFVAIEPGSVVEPRVHVMTHGWGRGLGPALRELDGFVRVWDEACETEDGRRFDRWFGPLSEAILDDDPEAAVLAFTWVDESATTDSMFDAPRSQARTTINGQRLGVAMRHALGGEGQAIHVIGYSHGAKVATVGAALMEPLPVHLTLLDSPDNLAPVVGGALNDLSSYLRILAPGNLIDGVFIDNYPSQFGVHYGTFPGLGTIHDIELDPEAHPLESAPSPHAYAWAWYLETARNPDLGVGYAWSPMRRSHHAPESHQMKQATEGETGPFDLVENTDVQPSDVVTALRVRAQQEADKPRMLSTDGSQRVYGFFWRRSGDLWATAPIEWHHGPDDAYVTVIANGIERARSVKGWAPSAMRKVDIPLGGARFGPMFITVELRSAEPAAISVGRAAAVNGFTLPTGAEFQAWGRPIFWATVVGTLFGLLALAMWPVRRARRRRRRQG